MRVERWSLEFRERATRLSRVLARQDGYSSEFAVITALAIALGVAVAAIVAAKVIFTANGIATK